MKNSSTTYEVNAYPSLSAQQTFLPDPFPRKYLYSVIDDLQQAEHAVQALQNAGYHAQDIYLFASQQFMAAVEQRSQLHSRLLEVLLRFFTSTDDGFFGDGYLYEAHRGHHILVVHLLRAGRMEQIRDLLVPYHTHHIKYIGTWTVVDLHPSTVSHGAER